MKIMLQRLGGIFLGFVSALVSCGIVLGSIVLSLTEGGIRLALAPASTSIPFDVGALLPSPTPPLPAEPLFPGQPTYTATAVSLPMETPTITLPPPPTDCPPPQDWTPITIAPGDTLRILAGRYSTTQEALAEGNCLITSRLIAGSILYVPGSIPTPPPLACGPPPGWVFYTVRPGDTLFRLSMTFGVSISQLQLANCMGDSTRILAGQRIYAPFLPPILPSPTPTPTSPPATEPIPSPEPPTLTPTSLPPPTATLTSSPTSTTTPSETPPPSSTPTPTPSPTSSSTPPPAHTSTPTNAPPTISPIPALSTDEDLPVGPVTFTIGDLETPDEELQVMAISSNPALLPAPNVLVAGSGSDRSLTLTPAPDQSGVVTVTITVTDSLGSQASTSFELEVHPVNDSPVALDDMASTEQDTPVSIPVLANDLDVDGDTLQIAAVDIPSHGSVQVEGGQLVYTPDPGYTGDDSFNYTITDGFLESPPASVTVTINPPD